MRSKATSPRNFRARLTNRLLEILEKRAHHWHISHDALVALYRFQKGRCAICGRKLRDDFAVDHNHYVHPFWAAIRGLLCTRCNLTLPTNNSPAAQKYTQDPPAHQVPVLHEEMKRHRKKHRKLILYWAEYYRTYGSSVRKKLTWDDHVYSPLDFD